MVFGQTSAQEQLIGQVRNMVGRQVRQRFFSFGLVLAVGFLLLVSLVAGAASAAVGKCFGGMLPLPEFVLGAIDFLVSLSGTVVLFALMFRYVPEARIRWRKVWVGAYDR